MTAYNRFRARSKLTDAQRAAWFGPLCPGPLAQSAADRLTDLLGTWLGPSPASTMRGLMDTLRPRGMAPRQPVLDWPPVAQRANTVTDYIAPPNALDLAGYKYLHAYDRNGQYLAACSSVELGIGELEHGVLPQFNAAIPGYWRFDERWYVTPEASYLRSIGALGEPDECHGWLRHGRALTPWQHKLRDARRTLVYDQSDAGQIALRALKSGVNVAVGWLCGYWFNPAHPNFRPETAGFHSPQYRPDWRHMIVSTSRTNMIRAVNAINRHARVVAVHIDQVYVLSNEPAAWMDALDITIGRELREWKVRFDGVPIEAVAHCFDGKHSALQLDNACEDWEAANGDD